MTTDKPHHIDDVRAMLIEQMRAVRTVDRASLDAEVKRAEIVARLGQVLVGSALAEVAYINAVQGASDSAFLQAKDEVEVPRIPTEPQGPFAGLDRNDPDNHGPDPRHPWRAPMWGPNAGQHRPGARKGARK